MGLLAFPSLSASCPHPNPLKLQRTLGEAGKACFRLMIFLLNPRGSVPKVRLAKLHRLCRACQKLQKACGGLVWAGAPRKTKRANTKRIAQIYFSYKPLIGMERTADARTLWNVAKVINLMSRCRGIGSKGRNCRYAGLTEAGGACGNSLRSPPSSSASKGGANTQQAFVSLAWLRWNH